MTQKALSGRGLVNCLTLNLPDFVKLLDKDPDFQFNDLYALISVNVMIVNTLIEAEDMPASHRLKHIGWAAKLQDSTSILPLLHLFQRENNLLIRKAIIKALNEYDLFEPIDIGDIKEVITPILEDYTQTIPSDLITDLEQLIDTLEPRRDTRFD